MSSNPIRDLNQIYLNEVSADAALRASKKADVERGKAAAAGDKEKAVAKAQQASRLYKAQAAKRKKEGTGYVQGPVREDAKYGYDKDGNSLNPVDIEKRKKKEDDLAGSPKNEELQQIRALVEKEVKVKDTKKVVDAIRAYDKSKDASDDATYDSDEGDKEKADIEKKYAAKERGEIDKDDPNWKKRKYHTGIHGEEVEILKGLLESGKLSEEEVKSILWEGYQRNPEEGERKEREANKKYERVRGERTPMPPRGNKKREEFEKWYAANVR